MDLDLVSEYRLRKTLIEIKEVKTTPLPLFNETDPQKAPADAPAAPEVHFATNRKESDPRDMKVNKSMAAAAKLGPAHGVVTVARRPKPKGKLMTFVHLSVQYYVV